MVTDPSALSPLYRFWNLGQQHLAAGRYVSSRSALEAAEGIAWRLGDFRSLARIYLPLLEARRQIRYNAVEGRILFLRARINGKGERESLRQFGQLPAGTLLLICHDHEDIANARAVAKKVYLTSRGNGNWLETLLILNRGKEMRLVSPVNPILADGLPIFWTTDAKSMIGPSTDPELQVPLPPPGMYEKESLHVLARESLLIAWEALALRWQHRHPPGRRFSAVEELAWLRRTLLIDPACEPVTMRLIALAEAADRAPGEK